MRFRELFRQCRFYRKSYNKKELGLKVCEEAGELARAVNEFKDCPEDVKQEIGDVILACMTLYLRYDNANIEELKSLIARKLERKKSG